MHQWKVLKAVSCWREKGLLTTSQLWNSVSVPITPKRPFIEQIKTGIVMARIEAFKPAVPGSNQGAGESKLKMFPARQSSLSKDPQRAVEEL